MTLGMILAPISGVMTLHIVFIVFCYRYETFLKMCATHDHLVHVAEDCLGIHKQSRGTNNIFQKTDVIEEIVNQHAKSVYDFHTTLQDTISRLPPPPTPPPEPNPEPSSKIMRLIEYYDRGTSPTKSNVQVTQITTEHKLEGAGVDAALLAKRLDRSPFHSRHGSRHGSPSSSASTDSISKRLHQLSPDGLLETNSLRVPISPAESSSVDKDPEEKSLHLSLDDSPELSDQQKVPIKRKGVLTGAAAYKDEENL